MSKPVLAAETKAPSDSESPTIRRSTGTFSGIAMATTLAIGMLPGITTAGDFAYETLIYMNTDRTPAESHTTIFVADSVFDWQEEQAMVIDFVNQKLVLLNAKHRLKTTLDFAGMQWRLGQTKIALKQQETRGQPRARELAGFLLQPSYDIIGNGDSRVVAFQDSRVTYNISVIKPSDADLRQKLARYLDFTTRLSAIQNPWGFARMPINDWLNQHDMVPTRVEREQVVGPGQKSTVRSQHEVREQLSTKDRTKIDEINFWLKDFQGVEFDTYQQTVH